MNHIETAKRVWREKGPFVFIIKATEFSLRTVFQFLCSRIYIYRINKLPSNLAENNLVDFVLASPLIAPIQVPSEIANLVNALAKTKPKTILEIGTAKGGTLFLFSRISDQKARIISVDLPGGAFGGGYPRWKIPLYRSFASGSQEIFLLREDSHSLDALRKVKEILGQSQVDFLFIDGDHSYEGVKKDFELYSPLVKKGGLIGLHDICRHSRASGCEVDRFWDEIRTRYGYREFIENSGQSSGGIGLLEKG